MAIEISILKDMLVDGKFYNIVVILNLARQAGS
jgi:hypothetical protein